MPLFCLSCGKVVNGKYCVHCRVVTERAEAIGRAKMKSHFLLLHFNYKIKQQNDAVSEKEKEND